MAALKVSGLSKLQNKRAYRSPDDLANAQEELKKLAAEVRERKLKEAAAELGAADEAYRGENARAVKDREDAEKAEK